MNFSFDFSRASQFWEQEYTKYINTLADYIQFTALAKQKAVVLLKLRRFKPNFRTEVVQHIVIAK